jgi:hypothetical protein
MPSLHRTLTLSPVNGEALALTDTLTQANSFVMGYAAGGMIYRDAGGTAGDVTIRFHADPLDNGNRHLLVDHSGTPVQVLIGPSECCPLPDGLFAAGRVLMSLVTGQTASVRIAEKS